MGDVYTNPPQSRNEAILESIVEGTEYTDPPQSRIEDLLLDVKEVIEQGGGGTTVVANPEGTPTDDLSKLQVGSTIYAIPEGTEVEANPQDSASETLSKLKVDDTIYSIPNGGGGGGTSDYTELTNKPEINGNTLSGNKTGAQLGLVNAENGKGLSENDFTDALKTKLDNIEAGAEVNVQADWTEADNTADDYIKNKPNLATVATSGSYDDLSDKPTIPVQVQADWSEADDSAVDFIKNKPNLATVATSGSYNDLSNKPTIPAAQVNADWNASSGVAEILNKPNIPAAQVNSDWNASSGVAEILNKPTIPSIANCYETTDTAETTLADDDYVPFYDTSATAKRKTLWSNIKSVLSGLFCKISAIGTNETGTTASKAYAVGEHFYKNGKFCTAKTAIASGATFTLGTNYVEGTVADYINPPSISEMVSPTEVSGTRFNVIEGGYKQIGKHVYINMLIKQNKTNFPEMLVGDLSTGNTGYDTGLINFPTPKNHGGVSFMAIFLNKSPSAAENIRKTRYGFGLATIYEESAGHGQMSLYTYHAIPSSLTDNIFVQVIGEYECA